MKELKSKKGITLIALVITIIVLLILAAVSISAIVDENGIVSKAKKAENDTIEGKEEEFVELAYSSIFLESATEEMTEEEKREALEKELKNLAGDEAVTVENNGDRTYTITFTETGNEYEIELNTSNDNLGYTQKDIEETLKYFTFDESTGVLTSKEEMIGYYLERNISLPVAVFPKEINGVPVTAIESFEGEGLLANIKDLEKVIILAEIETIGYWDYLDCTNLKSIELPSSVTSIGGGAFSGCTGLTSIELPDSLTNVAYEAFNGCKSLTSIEIPVSVTSIAGNAFSGCTGLTSIKVDEANTTYDSRENCNAIIRTATNTLILGCTGLTSITIPDSVTSIGGGAFFGCTGLTSITIPDSVTSIGIYAFSGCTGLTSITIPDSVTSIGSDAFNSCTGLTSITIPDSVTSMGFRAFSGCTGLTSIELPSSVTSIGDYVFRECTGLTSVEISSGLTKIGSDVFEGCTVLTSIKVDEANTKYDSRENCNAIIETATNTLMYGCKNTTIPSSVTSIGSDAFNSCTGLTSVTIPSSVTSIKNFAFDGCTGLKEVYFEQTTAPTFGTSCFRKTSGDMTTFYFKNSTVANAFTTSYYNLSYGTKSTDYSW